MAKVFTLAEVAKHNTKNDCWLSIFGKVLDVTCFLEEHPGGGEVLLNAAGKDATDDFEDVGHTHTAWSMLDKYYIGELDKSTITESKLARLNPIHKRSKSKYLAYLLRLFIPLLLFNLLFYLFSNPSSP